MMESKRCDSVGLIESPEGGILPSPCWRSAKWQNLRWSDTVFCEHCKETLSKYYTNDWVDIKEDKDGK